MTGHTNAGPVEPAETQEGDPEHLRRLLRYANKVFSLTALLGSLCDTRVKPRVSTALVARIIFLTGLLRLRSFNALEPKLAERGMQSLLGRSFVPRRVCSVEALGYSLARMDHATARQAVVDVVRKAERNKAFREGSFGSLRFVGLDGWETSSSRHRHCSACLTRQLTINGNQVTEYYHRCVVALLLDDRLEVVLDMEPVRSADAREEAGEKDVEGHEGELTAAKRLVRRLRATYGRWLDVLVTDALYANGPFLTVAEECHFGVVSVLKKKTDEPLKEALAIWGDSPPEKVIDDPDRRERLELWDCPAIETLSSYRGKIRVVRGRVYKRSEGDPHTWCFAVTGIAARRLSARQIVLGGRSRWHLENTGFHQWVTRWRFGHVFTHHPDALQALFWLFFLAFNFLQLFLYRQLNSYGRDKGRDVTRTISRLVDEMNDELARLRTVVAWNTS